jgi:hypothetical protein
MLLSRSSSDANAIIVARLQLCRAAFTIAMTSCDEGIIHFRRRRVQERSDGGAKQVSRASANAAAASKSMRH